VIDEFPNDGARGASVRTNVIAEFSEGVRGVDEDTFVLFRSSTGADVPADVFRGGDSDRWILDPDRRLREDTRYTVELEGGGFGIRDFGGNALFDTDWSFRTEGDDRNGFGRPRVIDRDPNDGARGVSRFTDVAVLFNERVRNVNSRTFTLFNARNGRSVDAEVFRTGSREWVLEPDRRLSRNTRYVVELDGGGFGIRDFDGNRLRDTDWTFRTGR
jgi:Bacterial Ig-like domain